MPLLPNPTFLDTNSRERRVTTTHSFAFVCFFVGFSSFISIFVFTCTIFLNLKPTIRSWLITLPLYLGFRSGFDSILDDY
ncbi:hypothetical protein L1887_06910 [Cichorium endivia]|nr:hypothetical protein L1887_06910 [Cichorium endivia]